jgi:tRNA (guanine6-N2)-methyltransferase
VLPGRESGRLRLAFAGPPAALERLRTIVAVHAVHSFDVARPRALLGDAALRRVIAAVAPVARRHGGLRTMRLSAAGAGSPELVRLRDEIAAAHRLEPVDRRAELLLALRRGGRGWELLVRTTPRPLSARDWRVCDLPGALDASVAAAMVRLVVPTADQRYLNLAAGSATLLIERLAVGPAAVAVGVDDDDAALACAARNLAAAGLGWGAALVRADAARLPLAEGGFDAAVADLPFGQLSGSAESNRRLYPAILAEARRALVPGGRFALITAHAAALAPHLADWTVERRLRVSLPYSGGYVTPGVWLLRR